MVFSAAKLVASAAVLVATLLSPSAAECTSQDSPNPIFQDYPNVVSGNLNTTIMIVPITMEKAREAIPNGWGILEDAFRSLLPSFPEGMYPMMVVGAHDHDLHLPVFNFSLPDFTVCIWDYPKGVQLLTSIASAPRSSSPSSISWAMATPPFAGPEP